MSINKRNIDTDQVSSPSPGPIRPSGTGNHATHRRENELAAEDAQRRGVAGRKAGPLPPVAAPDDLCVRDMDEPMTEDQAEHLRLLCEAAGEEFDQSLSHEAAGRQIERLQHKAGFKP